MGHFYFAKRGHFYFAITGWEAVELADIFRQYGPAYRQAHPPPLHQHRLMGGPAHVLEYLGRYTHRVAISSQRLLALRDGPVSFAWTDYRDSLHKVMRVPAEEFIRLLLQHALPPGFQRIRYYGFLASCHRAGEVELCRNLLATPYADLLPRPNDYNDLLVRLRLCPKCGIGTMVQLQTLFPGRGPVPMLVDTL